MDKFFIRSFFLLFTVCVLPFEGIASGEECDFATAYSVGISKKFVKRVELGLTETLVLNDNSTNVEKLYTTADVSCAVVKKIFKVGIAYRAIAKHADEGFDLNHRFAGYTNLKYDIRRFTIAWKSKYQMTYRPEKAEEKQWKNYWRNRLSVSMKVPKLPLYPSLSAEVYYRTNNYKGNVVDRMKYEAALKYQINKKNSLELYYDFYDAMNVKHPENVSLLGIAYQISF